MGLTLYFMHWIDKKESGFFLPPPPPYSFKECFTPILLGLKEKYLFINHIDFNTERKCIGWILIGQYSVVFLVVGSGFGVSLKVGSGPGWTPSGFRTLLKTRLIFSTPVKSWKGEEEGSTLYSLDSVGLTESLSILLKTICKAI